MFAGSRVAKNSPLVEVIGAIDELNAVLGTVKGEAKLEEIQKDLFAIGSKLAGYETRLDLEKRVRELEAEIDMMWKNLPPLKNFILPRGELHLARAVCRRAERAAVTAKVEFAYQYLNRLSDYLFCLARWENFKKKRKEIVWKP